MGTPTLAAGRGLRRDVALVGQFTVVAA